MGAARPSLPQKTLQSLGTARWGSVWRDRVHACAAVCWKLGHCDSWRKGDGVLHTARQHEERAPSVHGASALNAAMRNSRLGLGMVRSMRRLGLVQVTGSCARPRPPACAVEQRAMMRVLKSELLCNMDRQGSSGREPKGYVHALRQQRGDTRANTQPCMLSPPNP